MPFSNSGTNQRCFVAQLRREQGRGDDENKCKSKVGNRKLERKTGFKDEQAEVGKQRQTEDNQNQIG